MEKKLIFLALSLLAITSYLFVLSKKPYYQESLRNALKLTPTPTLFKSRPTPEVKGELIKVTPTADPDPYVNCRIHEKCGGGTKWVRSSICNNSMYCCYFNDGTSKLMTKQECDNYYINNPPSNSKLPPVTQQNTQPTSENNVYCWNNTYDYAYYTSSGDKCNEDNLKSSTYKTCMDTQKFKSETCKSVCERELENDRAACVWAYTGPNAGIEQNPDLYGECLNAPEESAIAFYGICLEKCTNQYTEDINQCSY